MKKLKKNIKGITLVALVVTIIVLLILAGIAINLSIGNNGLFRRAQNATNMWDIATKNEENEILDFSKFYDNKIKELELSKEKNTNVKFRILVKNTAYGFEGEIENVYEYETSKGMTWFDFFERKKK